MWCGRHSLGSCNRPIVGGRGERVKKRVCVFHLVHTLCVCMLMCLIKGVGDHALALSSSSRLTQI